MEKNEQLFQEKSRKNNERNAHVAFIGKVNGDGDDYI